MPYREVGLVALAGLVSGAATLALLVADSLFAAAAGAFVCTLSLSGLVVLGYRETQRTLALDRRLALPRGLAAGGRPGRRRRGGGGRELRTAGRALLQAATVLVPIGAAEREKLTAMLREAGFGHRDALSVFLSGKIAASAVAGAGAGVWAVTFEPFGQHPALAGAAALAGLVAGGVVPEYVLRGLLARRVRRMAAALPNALDLMVMSLESGLTFERALVTVARELVPIEPRLAAEFDLIEAELRVGVSRRSVLQEFRERTQVEGLKDLATTLIQSERYGTPLTQSMKNIAAGERVQRMARITARAERLPVLMTLPMLFFVVPGTILLVAGPSVLTALKALQGLGG